jgi:TIR domain
MPYAGVLRVNPRDRWGAQSMILRRWLVGEVFDPEAGPACEIERDGTVSHIWCRHAVLYDNRATGQHDFGLIRRLHVREGSEIGPSGDLFEFEGTARLHRPETLATVPFHSAAHIRLTRRERYPSVFLNYRRDDADAYAGRLHEVLVREFGENEIFLDEFSVLPGEEWGWTIQQAVVHARVMVTLIGRQWLAVRNGDVRRIDMPDELGSPRDRRRDGPRNHDSSGALAGFKPSTCHRLQPQRRTRVPAATSIS